MSNAGSKKRFTIPRLQLHNDLHDSGTQTSKTILELAKMQMMSGDMSPDSLMSSPHECDSITDASLEESPPQAGKQPFHRRQYLYGEKSPSKNGDSSLIEMFMSKTKGHNNGEAPCTQTRAKFLQQTSPLRYIAKDSVVTLKSQSYVEPKRRISVETDLEPRRNRFKIKNVKECTYRDETKPVKYYCPKLEVEKIPIDVDLYSPKTKECPVKRGSSFMCPTISSENKNKLPEVHCLNRLISPTRRGRSYSPEERRSESKHKIPYIDQSEESCTFKDSGFVESKKPADKTDIQITGIKISNPILRSSPFDEDLLKIDQLSLNLSSEGDLTGSVRVSNSTSSVDNAINCALSKVRDRDWNTALKGLAEVIELCRALDSDLLFPHMTTVNQRMIELLRSSRSHVCRTACQAAGHLFELVKDTRRPEFDDTVNILLCKTADANKFIRKDANLALDCMVTHISTFHAVRTLCAKGPTHKNDLVRTATARLLVCAVVIAGTDTILNQSGSEHTRKRLITNMVKFLEDKNLEARKYGERLYKVLSREPSFDIYLKRYLEKEDIVQMRRALKLIEKRR